MRPLIPVPAKGQKLRASWGAQVTNRVNELCAMAPSGVLQREGFGGIGAQPLPKNLRDRPGAAAVRPMPFDLKGEIETSEDGTQKRLVVLWYFGDYPNYANVYWNYEALRDLNSYQSVRLGWNPVHTGAWKSAENFSDSCAVQLWWFAEFEMAGSGGDVPTVTGTWQVVTSDQVDTLELETGFSTTGFNNGIWTKSFVALGAVRASASSGVVVEQLYHGNLYINQLLSIGGNGDGSGEDATNGTTYPMPFQYKRTDVEDSQGNVTSSYSIINCRFYWDGEYHTLSDYTPPATGSVYLVATKSGAGAGTWSFQLSTSPGTAANGAQSVKLYDFASSQITMDYRTTTLMFGPGPRDFVEAKKKDGSISASMDATGASAKLTLDGASHDVVIDATQAQTADVTLRECDYYDGTSGTAKKVTVLASEAVPLGALPSQAFVTGISFAIANGKLQATLNRKNVRTGGTSSTTVDVCNVRDLSVVTNTDYTNPNFTQQKQTVTVIGEAPSSTPTGEVVFTTTPLSSE